MITTKFGNKVFRPYIDELDVKNVDGCLYPLYVKSVARILRGVDSDLVYCFKPMPSSFGVGLLAKQLYGIPAILDIEDWDFAPFSVLPARKLLSNYIRGLRDPNGAIYMRAMESLISFADAITVHSNFLRKKFGGVLLPSGVDTDFFNPYKYDGGIVRKEWGLKQEKVILFAGTPRPHKGLDDLARAIAKINNQRVKLLIVADSSVFDANQLWELKHILNDALLFVDAQPHKMMPLFLAAADIIVIPTKRDIFANAQVPAKIYEAMAMEKPIVATDVSDVPEILQGCGIIIRSGDIGGLSKAISQILNNEALAKELGKKARRRCVEKYSWIAMDKILLPLVQRFLKN